MAPKTRSQVAKAEPRGSGEPETKPASKKRARAAPKTSRARKKPHQTGESVDEGRNSSKAFLAKSKQGAKSIKETKREFRKKTAEAITLIEKKLRSDWPASEQRLLAEYLPSDIASCLPYIEPNSQTPVAHAHSTVYKKAQDIFAQFEAMAKDYDVVNRRATDIKGPNSLRWEQDIKELRALNEAALGLAFQNLNNMIMPNASSTMFEGTNQDIDDIEAMASELLAEATPEQGEQRWGAVAQGLLRAFSGAVVLLPRAEES